MHTYTFVIYYRDFCDPDITIVMKAKDRFSLYESIIIKTFDEKPEEWSTSIRDSYMKEAPYSGELFFDWLSEQCLFDYGACHVHLALLSPFVLYYVLNRTDEYRFSFDSDDPANIEDPGSFFTDMFDDSPGLVY